MDVDTEIPSFPQNTVAVRGQSIPLNTNESLFDHPTHAKEIPVHLKDSGGHSIHSIPRIVAEHESSIHGIEDVIGVDDDSTDDDLTIQSESITNRPIVDSLNNEIEEQMIMAAIEASKKESKGHIDHQIDVSHVCFFSTSLIFMGCMYGVKL